MPTTCSVVGCRSGYDNNTPEGVSFHGFPLARKELLSKWISNLARKGFTPTKNSKVCSLHFKGGRHISGDREVESKKGVLTGERCTV